MYFLGIDLTATAKRASACAVVDGDANIVYLDSFESTVTLLDWLEAEPPSVIAIDAPLSLPLGLCCLEETHKCFPSMDGKGRASERELAQLRIGCFFTTKRSIIKTMIYRALELREELQRRGHEVIEVYPYASKVILFGGKIPRKNNSKGVAFLKDRLSRHIGGLSAHEDSLDHDKCDALLAAHTAYLHHNGRTDSLGIPEEGFIVVPELLPSEN